MTTLRRWTRGLQGRDPWATLGDLQNALGRTPVHGAHRFVTAATTVLDSDYLLLVDTTSGAVTVTLPDALVNLDRQWVVKHYAGANAVTVDASGSQLIYAAGAGATTLVWNAIGTSYTFHMIATSPTVGAVVVI